MGDNARRIFDVSYSLSNIESALNIFCRSLENEEVVLNSEDYLNMIYLIKDQICEQRKTLESII